jgi:hypothetical protein
MTKRSPFKCFKDKPGDHPPGGDAKRPVPALASEVEDLLHERAQGSRERDGAAAQQLTP